MTVYAFTHQGQLIAQAKNPPRVDGGPNIIVDIKIGDGDTVLVGDASHRVTVYSPELTLVRAFQTNVDFTRATIVSGGLIAAADRTSLAFLNTDGRRVESYAISPADKSLVTACRRCEARWLTAGAEAKLWATRTNRIELEQIGQNGLVRTRLTRNPKWFVPWTAEVTPFNRPDWIPQPHLGPAFDAGNGIVWVVATVPSGTHRTAKPVSANDEDADLERMQASILQAIDVAKGRVLVERRLPGTFTLLSASQAYAYRSTSKGDVVVDIARFAVAGSPSGFNYGRIR